MTTSVDVARLPLLILNDELPTFQGSGGNEFLCTWHLQRHGHDVGVVAMAHFRADRAGIQRLKDAGVKFFLWESPWIDAPPPAGRRPWWRRTHSALFRAWVASRAGAEQPLDTVLVGGSFRNLAAPLLQALRARTWPVVTVIQTHAAAIVDLLPRPLVSVLVMHDIRALVFERRAAVETSAVARRRFGREAARSRAFEKAQCQKYDLGVTRSDQHAD